MSRDQVIRVNAQSEEQIHLLQALESEDAWEVCAHKATHTAFMHSATFMFRFPRQLVPSNFSSISK